jgi:phosphate transport system substrate-binding protein
MSLRLAGLMVGAAALLVTSAAADELTVQGSSTFERQILVPHRAAIEAASGHKLNIVSTKSSDGILSLFERRAHLAMISAPLEGEVSFLREAKPSLPFERLRSFAISRTRVAFAIHPSNPVRSASIDQIRRVLLGEITNWQELGGADLPIQVVTVRGGGGVTVSVESALLGGKPMMAPHPIRVQAAWQVANVVQDEPAALGLAQVNILRQYKLPELATDRYIEQQLSLVSLGEPSPAMQAVIEATQVIAAAEIF